MKHYMSIIYPDGLPKTVNIESRDMSKINVLDLSGAMSIDIYEDNRYKLVVVMLGQQYSKKEVSELSQKVLGFSVSKSELLGRDKLYPKNKGYVRTIGKTWYIIEPHWYIITSWNKLKDLGTI